MTFASLTWLWFALAIGCILAGMALTGRRVAALPPAKREGKLAAYMGKERSERGNTICSRCAQPLEPDARFCGACGLYVSQQAQKQKVGKSV